MKRLLLQFPITILAFLLGVGLDRLLSKPAVPTPVPQRVVVSIPKPIAAPAPIAAATPSMTFVVFDYDSQKFYPDGDYVLVGQKPKELEEFVSFYIGLNSDVDGQLTGNVGVSALIGDDDEYESQTAVYGLITDQRVFFVTPMFRTGFEYRFDGEFLRRDLLSAGNTNKAVLKGKLTKTKNGRKVAERIVSFRLELHGC